MGETDTPVIHSPGIEKASPFRGRRGHALWASLCLFLLACGVFYPVTGYEFVNLDDPAYVYENPHVTTGLTWDNVSWSFTSTHSANWHPLTWISHMLDVEVYGLRAGGHHLTNLLLHALSTVLLFWFLRRATDSLWRSALVAALFALHPAHVESVAWVAERKDVLSAAFGLTSLWFYATYARGAAPVSTVPKGGRAQAFAYAAAFLFFAFGLMSKPMLVTLPFVMLLLDYWPFQRLRGWKSFNRLGLEKVPFFLLMLASCLVTIVAQEKGGAVQNLRELSLPNRVENAAVSYVRYLGEAFWPIDLATPYPHPGDWPIMPVIGSVLLLATVTAGLWFMRRRLPFALTGWLWFIGMLVPVIGLVQVGAQAMADRYTYLPYIGLFLAVVWSVHALATQWSRPNLSPLPPRTTPAAALPEGWDATSRAVWTSACLAAVILGVMAWRTNQQIPVWRNSETLFRHAVSVTESNWIAYYNLGCDLEKQGRIQEAISCYKRAVEIDPKFPDPLNNIGCALASLKRYQEAIPFFEAMLKLQPDFFEAELNIANAQRQLGHEVEAIAGYRAVLEKQPGNRTALNSLGTLLAARDDFQQAIPHLQKSLSLEPNQSTTHYTLANALVRSRRLPEALDHYRQAADGLPDSPSVHNDYALCLARLGRLDEAAQCLQKALVGHPRDTTMRLTLGRVLANQQKTDEAIALFEEIISIAPDDADAHASLGPLLAMKGQLDLAVQHLTAALKIKPNDAAARFNLGRALATQGKIAEARLQFQEALRLKPDYSPAHAELENLEKLPPK